MVDALSESFDDESGFTKSSTFFVEGAGLQFLGLYDPLGAASDFDGALTPPSSTFTSGYSGFTGPFLIGADLDGAAPHPDTVTFTWSNIDVTGLRNVQFSGLFASLPDATEGPDAGDFILVEVSIDGGAFFSLLDFRADGVNGEFRLDTNNDGVGDGAQLTGAAQSFSAAIIASGASSVNLRLTVKMDGPHEDFAVDDFKVTGALNTPPVAQDDSVSTNEGAVLNGNVLVDNGAGADSDADMDPLSVTAVNGQAVNVGSQITLASGALLTVNANGTFSYDPNGQFETLGVGASDTDSFTYTISDGFGGTDTATATVTITGLNDAPVARNDSVSTNENTVLNGNVLADNGGGADSDIDAGDSLTVTAVNGQAVNVGSQITLASGALLTVNANGTFGYDPNGQFETLGQGASDSDSFTYTISDGKGGVDTATATVTINGINDAPDAKNDDVTTNKNTTLNGNVLNDNGNGADDDIDAGDILTVTAVNGQAVNVGSQITLASGALLTVNQNGTFSYDPNGVFVSLGVGASTTENFTYTISDGNGGSDTATATVTITGANNNPVARDDFFTTDEDSSVGGNVLNDNGSGADTDPNTGDVLSVIEVNGQSANVGSQITLASGALLTVNSDGTFSYDTNNAFNSLAVGSSDTDSFTYTISDGNGGTDTATTAFTITGVNDAPTAFNNGVSTDENSIKSGNVLGNDVDVDIGDVLSVSAVNGSGASVGNQITLASGALLTVNADGGFFYNPNGQFETLGVGASDTDSFTYTASDGNGGFDSAMATITITGVNDAPIARNDSISTNENTVLNGNVFNNNGAGADSDIDIGDIFSVSAVNGQGASVGNQITLASGALLTVNVNGIFSYNPNGQFETLGVGATDTDSFTYTISDGKGGFDTATATVTIAGVNDAPIARNDAVSTGENTIHNGNIFNNNGAGADSDIDIGDTFSVSAVNGLGASVGNQITLASGALLTVNVNGTFSYNPNGQFETLGVGATDTDSFTYTISDGKGGFDTATATVTITGVNDVPIARNDAVSTAENTIHNGNIFNNNGAGADSDIDIGDVLSVSAVNGQGASVGNQITLASGALLTVNANGTFSYNPNGQFETLGVGAADTDSFTYTISDGKGGTDTATATVTITGVNDAPIAQNDSFATDESLIKSGNVFNNNGAGADSDIDIGDVLAISAVNGSGASVGSQITLASGALITVNANGTMFYNPNGAFETLGQGATDTDSFTYTTADGQGGSDIATVTFTITGLNDAPVAQNDAISVGEDGPLNASVFVNNGSGADSDIDIGDVLVVASVNGVFANVGAQITLGSGALLTVNADGTLNYDPNGQFETLGASATATETFDYAISDGKGGTDNATATVTINGVNDAPIAQNDSFSTPERNGFGGNVFNNNGAGADTDIDIGDILNVIEINGQAANVGAQITIASGALLTVNADGTLSYHPNGAFDFLVGGAVGNDSFTYMVSDGNGGVKTATVFIDIIGELGGLFTGTAGADIINSTVFADTVNGLAGDDQLDGLGGADEINGGIGADLLMGGNGDDTVIGAADNDTITGGAGDDSLTGGDGDDDFMFTDSAGDDTVEGGAGFDRFIRSYSVAADVAGSDTSYTDAAGGDALVLSGIEFLSIVAGGAADSFDFSAFTGTMSVIAGAGADSVQGGAGNDDLVGQEGADTLRGNGGRDTLNGGAFTDVLYGDGGNDELFGGTGDDNLFGGAQNDLLTGGDGADNLSGQNGNDSLFGGNGGDTLAGGAGADMLTGFAGDDLLAGGNGADMITGGLNNDTLTGGENNDSLYGNEGADDLFGGNGADTLDGGFDGDSLTGNAGNDVVAGNLGNDTAYGGDGDDTVVGGGGNDSLFGNFGDDELFGGAGNDTLDGGVDNDLVAGDAGDDIVAGNIGNDTVFGGAGNDIVVGGDGDDSLFGNDGADQLFGGLDNDTLNGGDGIDILSGNDGDDVLFGGGGNDNVLGGEGADSINGGDGDDTVVGNFGADTLNGGAGDDTLLGGSGDDLFVFAPGAGNDQISDFVTGAGSNEAILLTGFGAAFDSFADVQAAASNDGFGNVIIDLGGGDSILLLGKSVSDLTADDFMFG